jgi:hypothetical protein
MIYSPTMNKKTQQRRAQIINLQRHRAVEFTPLCERCMADGIATEASIFYKTEDGRLYYCDVCSARL